MLIVHVQVQVKPKCAEAFKTASLDNARHSVQEPGIARFRCGIHPVPGLPAMRRRDNFLP